MVDREQRITNLTEDEQRSLEYLNYPTKPIIFPAQRSVAEGLIRKQEENIVVRFDAREAEIIGKEEVTIAPDHQYSLIDATVFSFNEAFARAEKGTELREAFEKEFEVITRSMEEENENPLDFGTWVYDPRERKIIQYASEYWHRMALYLTNSSLIEDPGMMMSFEEGREKFAKSVVAVIGLSVGNNVLQAWTRVARPENIIIADGAPYKTTNGNRVATLRSTDMVLSNEERKHVLNINGLRPKWQVAAEQIHALDPFMKIFCYPEANESNLSQFIGGNRVQPKASILVEVCDTTGVKIAAAEEARRQRVPFIRLTDAGSMVRMDIRRFDKDGLLPITLGVHDRKLHQLSGLSGNGPEDFFRFADALIGSHLHHGDEFGKLIGGELRRVSSNVPQIGSTAMAAAGWAGDVLGRILVGHEYPERMVLDLHHATIQTFGRVM